MHFSKVVYILGILLMCLAGSMLLPIPFSLYYGETDYRAFLISAGLSFTVGFLAFKTGRLDQDLHPKEGFAVVTFSWIFISLFGSLPFVFSGSIPSFSDAFFESMSGFTTTGASILPDIEHLPRGILFWRSFTQWLGGMGIIVLSLAILPFLGVGGMQLFKAEITGPIADKLVPRISQTAKILWGGYVCLSGIEVLLLLAGGMDFFNALCHTFGTVATGGFSTRNSSIGDYNSLYIDAVILFFMILAGTNFVLHYRFLKGDFRVYFRDPEFITFLILIVSATVFISFNTFYVYSGDSVKILQKTLFQVVSILTTTGYGTADYEQWSFSSQFTLFLLMLIGGCAGSTAGGMKVMRLYLLVQFGIAELKRLLHPHSVVPVRLGHQSVSPEIIANVLGYFVFFIFFFLLSVLCLSFIGLDMPTAFGAVAATLGNVGPGLGMVGPVDNYSHLPVIAKWMLTFLMLLGRLEVFTVTVLLAPDAWRK